MLGLVDKVAVNGDATRSAYRLTPRGESLRPTLDALYAWGEAAARELAVTIDGEWPHRAAGGVDE